VLPIGFRLFFVRTSVEDHPIGFGTSMEFATDLVPCSATRKRRLILVAYQASIETQFEVLTRNWVNADEAPRVSGGRDADLGGHALQEGLGQAEVHIANR
jgi:hypothetical protein